MTGTTELDSEVLSLVALDVVPVLEVLSLVIEADTVVVEAVDVVVVTETGEVELAMAAGTWEEFVSH